MQYRDSANLGCLLVAEFVDEGEAPEGLVTHPGMPVRPLLVAQCLDTAGAASTSKDFTVIMEGGDIATVRGHGLEVLQPTQMGGPSHYAILEEQSVGKVIVGLFRTDQVRGIFNGNVRQEKSG